MPLQQVCCPDIGWPSGSKAKPEETDSMFGETDTGTHTGVSNKIQSSLKNKKQEEEKNPRIRLQRTSKQKV
jgi:hypothetical protein